MQIRHADPATDGAGCAAVYAPYVTDSTISFEYEPPSGAEFSRRIARLSETHPFLVAEDDDDGRSVLVGFAYGSPHRERDAYRWAAEVSVYVSATHHRRGIARALYGTLFGLLERQGFRTLLAGVALPNEASVALHEAFGFKQLGVYRAIGWKFGTWWDVGWWQRAVGAPEAPVGDPPGPPPRDRDAAGGPTDTWAP
jgi:phosphinothricin acetyltransferase